jgi:hypothetical protein
VGVLDRTPAADAASVDLERWRGRSRELTDAGPLPWAVLFAGLETVALERRDLENPVSALGFDAVDRAGGEPDSWTTRLAGTRHGRQVELRHGVRDHGWGGTAMVTWVRAAGPHLHALGGPAGSFTLDPGDTPLAVVALRGLAAVPTVWSGVRIRSGPEGLVSYRKLSAAGHPQGYLYDLWLLEHLADLLATATLPILNLAQARLPYRTG